MTRKKESGIVGITLSRQQLIDVTQQEYEQYPEGHHKEKIGEQLRKLKNEQSEILK